ncbi:hypothetical protein [Sphingopyxis sp.]|uniref:hypothetical protein n=1 Tax=Sphingopyxis sp. TaxID=1908224 RepID=UPI001D5C369F|nr:hypothetical protein [Sphingopyxis sp.]MBW8296377.1 hypothetical protein [Sphingopyxis sp.]
MAKDISTLAAILDRAPAAPPPLRLTYTLRYDDDAFGVSKRIEFEAASPATALEIAQGEARGREALLLVDGLPLCRLSKGADAEPPFWILVPPNAARRSA